MIELRCTSRRLSHLRLVSANSQRGPEMATTTEKRPQPKTEKTKVPGIYRRGEVYLYSYRVEGRQWWGRAAASAASAPLRSASSRAARGRLRHRGTSWPT